MKSNSRVARIGLLLVISVAIAECVLIFKLASDNATMRASLDKYNKQGGSDVMQKLAKRDAELQVLRVQVQDLLKLRREARLLRAGSNDMNRLSEENRLLRDAVTNGTGPTIVVAADGDFVARDNWTFAGYATPEATLQSWMWSLREGDADAFLESLAPDGQARFAGRMQQEGKTQDEVIADLRRESENLSGFQILDENPTDDGSIETLVQMSSSGSEKTRHRFVFTRTGNEWKMSDAGVVEQQ